MKTKMAGVLIAAGLCLGWAACAWAESNTATTQNSEFISRQRFTRQQFAQLTSKMLEVSDLLEKSEPDSARALREAVNQAQRAYIAEDMDKVAEYLNKGMATAAASTEGNVIENLKKVLETLQRGTLEIDESKLKEWEKQRETIKAMIENEKKMERQSNAARQADQLEARMKDAAARLGDIISRQKALLDDTRKVKEGDASLRKLVDIREEMDKLIAEQGKINEAAAKAAIAELPVVGEAQKKNSGRTGALKGKMAAAADDAALKETMTKAGVDPKNLSEAADRLGLANGEMDKASDSLGKSSAAGASGPQEQAMVDLNAARDALNDALAKAGASTPSGQIGGKQSELASSTRDLAQTVKDIAHEAGIESPATPPAGEPKTGGASQPPGSTTQPDSTSQPSGSTSKPGDTASRPSGGEPSKGTSGSPKDSDATAGNISKAAGHMDEAADKLSRQNPQSGAESQQKALDELERRQKDLAELNRRIMEKAKDPADKRAEEQKALADKAGNLADTMKQPTPSDANKSSPSTPGQQSVADASKSMSQASSSLSQSDNSGANKDQNKALEELRKAEEELAKAIELEREQSQADKLAKIDALLQQVLDRQKKVSVGTTDVYGKRRENKQPLYDRPEEMNLKAFSDEEGRLGEEIKKVRLLLTKEGSTVVFPSILQEVQDDLVNVQKLLAEQQAGELTQGVQGQIERTLQELIDSIRKQMADRRNKKEAGGSGGQSGGKQPLLPSLAELKMLFTLQKQIEERTIMLNKLVSQNKLSTEDSDKQHKTLSERQSKVKDLARSMADKKKAEAENE